ncbi:MAG: hypothetical protein V4735_01955 [Pseudomonadota bacterium]
MPENQQVALPEPKAVDATADQNTQQTQAREPVRWFGVALPGPLSNLIHSVRDVGRRGRKRAIEAVPDWGANRSSQLVAFMQVAGEFSMFKANNTLLLPNDRPLKAIDYLVEPPKRIFKSVFENAAFNLKPKDLLTPKFYKDTVKSFTNLDVATKLDSVGGKRLVNRWQARSTFFGLVSMTVAMLLPDSKDKEADLERRTVMWHTQPLRYIGTTLTEAVTFPVAAPVAAVRKLFGAKHDDGMDEISKYRRQFTGLGMFVTGVCSFLSGFRNIGMQDKALGQAASNLKYVKNTAHSMGGLITATAATNLLFSVGSDQGWERWGGIQWLRMIFLPKSISSRYEKNDPQAHYYTGGQGLFQLSNTISYFIGGAEKKDGVVIDHQEARAEAALKGKEAKAARKAHHRDAAGKHGGERVDADDVLLLAAPATTVSQATNLQRAMPERQAETAVS